MLAYENIRCPYFRYPKLKIHVWKRFLERYEYMPIA